MGIYSQARGGGIEYGKLLRGRAILGETTLKEFLLRAGQGDR